MIAAVLDHLWQSTFFALGCAVLALVLRTNRAAVRYWIWLAASVKFLLPFSLLTAAGAVLFRPVAAPVPAPMVYALQPAARPFAVAAPAFPVSTAPQINWPLILLALWAAGFATVVVITAMRWARLRDNLRDVVDQPSSLPIPVKLSSSSIEPGLIGIWRPLLVLPDGFFSNLSAAEVDAVLAHELCHLKRRDNLTIALHMAVETVFWFHPLVWWIGARMIEAREYACDEAVLESGRDPQVYAESILKVCKHYLRSPLPSASGVSGADLKLRIESLFQKRTPAPLGLPQKGLLTACATAALGIPLMLGLAVSPMGPDKLHSAIDPALYGKYAGYYLLDPESVITNRWVDGHLVSHITNQPDFMFFPENASTFVAKTVKAKISFVTDKDGAVQAMIVHQNGGSRRAARIDAGLAASIEAASVTHYRSQKQGPGTEAALRRYIASLEAGKPDYQDMTDGLAAATRLQWPAIARIMGQWGAVKSIAFAGVSRQSGDMYLVNFQRGLAMFSIAPIGANGKMHGLFMQPLR